ncbi:MAG TPA: UDP-glucose 4-epimerase GalE [Candidatus Eisenbacteria bacterium]|nr:UDP-glucose 4-epimerase GalE [Candidatus Eisenbacteria bacterium]
MRILVTGGAGYIGSVVADRLLRAGHTVTVLDNLIMGWREAVPAAAEFIHADTGDGAALDQLFASHGFDAVLHFAALIEAGESIKVPELYFDNNSARTLTLLRVMLKHNVSRFVFSSTAAVYGEPQVLPIPEDHPLAPTNPYGESKLIVEQMLAWLHRAHGLRYASLRYFNAAGATPARGEAHRSESHLIPLILQVPLGQRESISIYGTDYPTKDGTCIRDYIHVDDLASAHILALQGLDTHATLICNLGSGSGFSVREIIEIARKVTRHPIPTRECPRRPGDPAELIASSDTIRRLLGWNPQYSGVESIIASAWQWHQSHPRGYRGNE